MKIAVIGTGISGLGAAHFLARRHEVTVFEQDSRAGGHTNTFDVATPRGTLAIDTGFIVCNPVNYPNFYPFLNELGVRLQDTDMSLGVSVDEGRIEWAGDENLAKIFAQPSLMFSPTHIRMLLAVVRFNKQVKQLLADDALPDITLGEFLEINQYPMALRVRYVAAMAGPIWSTSTAGVMEFPFPAFARFFESHGLLNVYERPQWQTVVGGSRSYVQKLLAKFGGEMRLNAKVLQLRRENGAAFVRTSAGEERFDAVICAAHSDQALTLLQDASDAERAILGNVPYAKNRAYLHTDKTLLPRRRWAWSSWNAILKSDALTDEPIGVTYWMNQLQRLPKAITGDTQYIVSLNPPRLPDPASVLYEVDYEHPQYNPATIQAQARLAEIQGQRHIWWAGAWTAYGFHEDGFKSALRVVGAIDRDCLPPYVSGIDLQLPSNDRFNAPMDSAAPALA
jgi:predicted NAD/FAD-binding protein